MTERKITKDLAYLNYLKIHANEFLDLTKGQFDALYSKWIQDSDKNHEKKIIDYYFTLSILGKIAKKFKLEDFKKLKRTKDEDVNDFMIEFNEKDPKVFIKNLRKKLKK
jgi:hypothetical protein